MAATPVDDVAAKLRAGHPDRLRAVCQGQDDSDALAAFLASPEHAEYFQLGTNAAGEVTMHLSSITTACSV